LLSSADMSNRLSLAQFTLICAPCNPSILGLLTYTSLAVIFVFLWSLGLPAENF
jgi:hypothetical protein